MADYKMPKLEDPTTYIVDPTNRRYALSITTGETLKAVLRLPDRGPGEPSYREVPPTREECYMSKLTGYAFPPPCQHAEEN